MIDKIEISSNNYKISDSFRKYATKRIGKLDRYLPRGHKKRYRYASRYYRS